jgi:hypothetical protein
LGNLCKNLQTFLANFTPQANVWSLKGITPPANEKTDMNAKAEIKAILERKFLALVKQGMSHEEAFKDVMGAFNEQFPGLIEKLSE